MDQETSFGAPPAAATITTAVKIDPITAVQDSIDGLALSLFEALRGVRDAVAPESLGGEAIAAAAAAARGDKDAADGSHGGDGSTSGVGGGNSLSKAFDLLEPNYDAFIVAYLKDEPYAKDLVGEKGLKKAQSSGTGVPRNKKEYLQLLVASERERDARVAQILARDVLAKSAAIDELVANIPGMGRTREMQMERIDELISANRERARELDEACAMAEVRREKVRAALRETTCLALGVEEEGS